MGRIGDRAVYDQADDLECRLHLELCTASTQSGGGGRMEYVDLTVPADIWGGTLRT